MDITSHLLAAGPGWRVDDIICTTGPGAAQFHVQRAVTKNRFQYLQTTFPLSIVGFGE